MDSMTKDRQEAYANYFESFKPRKAKKKVDNKLYIHQWSNIGALSFVNFFIDMYGSEVWQDPLLLIMK